MKENNIPIAEEDKNKIKVLVKDIKTKLYHVSSDAPDNISEEGKLMFGVLKEVFIETLGKK